MRLNQPRKHFLVKYPESLRVAEKTRHVDQQVIEQRIQLGQTAFHQLDVLTKRIALVQDHTAHNPPL